MPLESVDGVGDGVTSILRTKTSLTGLYLLNPLAVIVTTVPGKPETLSKAYTFALNAHKNQRRDSGDPYLMHPVAVADILTDLKLDSATIATGLLHDTIEDTKVTYKAVEKEFGKEVADLVDGVTKISELEGKVIENSKAENIRKLILATSKDIRVLLVKLADRLHNMRTLDFINDDSKKIDIALETQEIYAPLAQRLGMRDWQEQLEDLSFKKINPDARSSIVDRLNYLNSRDENIIDDIRYELKKSIQSDSLIWMELFIWEINPLRGQLNLSNKIRINLIFII